MTTRSIVRMLAVILIVMSSAVITQGTVLRAFVSSTGNDSNAASNCPQTNPCRTFAGALPTVTPGGELIALDTAGYGPLTGPNEITKAITIAAVPGARAFVIVATNSTGFRITTAANDLVTVRNISFNGTGAAFTTGILKNTGKLIIEDCEFTQLTGGLRVFVGTVLATRSAFIGNPGAGVWALGGQVDLQNCNISFNAKGIIADGPGGCPFSDGTDYYPASVNVRVHLGQVVGNTLAFEMLNPGTGCYFSSHGTNIFLRTAANNSDFTTDVPGYRSNSIDFLSVTGTGGAAPGSQVFIGRYTTTNQGMQP